MRLIPFVFDIFWESRIALYYKGPFLVLSNQLIYSSFTWIWSIKLRALISLTKALSASETLWNYTLLRLPLIVLNVFPMIGPSIISAAITTIATKTRMSAYSTKPWPFSFGANNIVIYSPFFWFSLMNSEPTIIIYSILIITSKFLNINVSLTIMQTCH